MLQAGAIQETITVTADAPLIDMRASESSTTLRMDALRGLNANAQEPQRAVVNTPSANVQSLQCRAAGVLPVRVEVPRTGTSHRFVKPLVVEEETVVSFRYKCLGR